MQLLWLQVKLLEPEEDVGDQVGVKSFHFLQQIFVKVEIFCLLEVSDSSLEELRIHFSHHIEQLQIAVKKTPCIFPL